MNGVEVFTREEIEKIKIREKEGIDFLGYVYIIECGKFIKIGCTRKPYKRFRHLTNILENYGRMNVGRLALSRQHSNYFQNERKMHEHFKEHRLDGSELFEVKFEKAEKAMGEILDFECKEKEAKKTINVLIEMFKKSYYKNHEIDENIFDKMTDEDIDKAIFMLSGYKNMREEIKMFFLDFLE